MVFLVIIYLTLLCIFAYRQWQYSLYFLILILPTYLIRFNFYGLPTTLLEITFLAIFLVWIVKFSRTDLKNLEKFWQENKIPTIIIGIFFATSILGVVSSAHWLKSLGEWRAYFVEPMLLFIMIVGCAREINIRRLILILGLSTLSISGLAIAQNIFGGPLAPSLWNDNFGGRVTSFFTSPNAIGLYTAPLFFITISLKKYITEPYQKLVLWSLPGLIAIAIYFSFSQGAWVALGVGLVVWAFLVGYKKIAISLVVAGVIFVMLVPSLRSAVMFADTAGQSRLELWSHTWGYLSESPTHFISGAGIRQFFEQVERPLFVSGVSERLIYPHNIILNFWSEIGFVGMLTFVGILICWLYWSMQIYKKDKWLGACLIGALVVFFVHGLVDVPYFKNDLAILFWVMFGVVYGLKIRVLNLKLTK